MAQMDVMRIIPELFLNSPDIDTVFEKLPGIIADRFGYPYVGVELYDGEKDEVVIVGNRGITLPHEILRVPADRAMAGTVIKTGKPMLVKNAGKRKDYAFEPLKKLKVKVFMGVPILLNKKVFGVIIMADKKDRPDAGRIFSLLQAITNYLAQSILVKQSDDLRRKSEEMFKTVADFTHDWEYWMDNKGNMKYCSPSCMRVTGYTSAELLKDPGLLRYMVQPESLEIYDEHLKNTEAVELDLKIIRKDNREAWISHNCVIVFDSLGNPAGRRVSDRDITERVMIEKFYQESERKFREVFNGSNDAIFLHSRNPDGTPGKFLEVNDTACKRLGYTKQEFYMLSYADIDASIQTQDSRSSMDGLNKTGSVTLESVLIAKNGVKIPVEISAKIIDMNGEKAVLSIARDITERKRTDTAIKQSEEKYRTLFEHMKSAFAYYRLILDQSGNAVDYEFIEVNAAYEAMTGWKRENVIGKTSMLIDPVNFKGGVNRLELYKNVALTGIPAKFEAYEEGTKRWFSVTAYSNKSMYFAVLYDDVTESRLSQEKIRKLSAAVEQSANMIVITDTEGMIEYVNKKFEEITGYTRDEAVGNNPRMLKSGHFDREAYAELWRKIKSGHDWRGEFHNRKKDGSLFWDATAISSIKDEKGVIINFIAIKEDITARKETENKLMETSRTMQDFLDNANEIIHIVRSDLTFEYVNKKWMNTLGYTPEEVLRINLLDIVRKDLRQEVMKNFVGRRAGENINHVEAVFVAKDGTEIIVEGNVINIMKDGKLVSVRAIFRDITDKRRSENELKESVRKLKELDVLKSNFTAMISHELRTPLTAIKGFTSFLLGGVSGQLNANQKEYVDIIKSNSDRLLKLINEILDISKIESGTFSISKARHDLVETVSKAIDDIEPVAVRKSMKVVKEMPQNAVAAEFDDYRIAQVVINLLNNAIKFSVHNSKIFVGVLADISEKPFVPGYVEKQPIPGIRYVVFYVRDEGMGIDRQNLSKIFDRFYQVSDDDQRVFKGVGLGLNISRSIVEAHGGIIWVESEGKGKGACFKVILPEA
jgi:PAS domain S-box-containing protein